MSFLRFDADNAPKHTLALCFGYRVVHPRHPPNFRHIGDKIPQSQGPSQDGLFSLPRAIPAALTQ